MIVRTLADLERVERRNIGNIMRTDLEDADLRNAQLEGASLGYANLIGADIQEANLRGADLRNARLMMANLRGANLENANLQEAMLPGANLTGANLRGANLTGTTLIDVDLNAVDLTGVDLTNAILRRPAPIYEPIVPLPLPVSERPPRRSSRLDILNTRRNAPAPEPAQPVKYDTVTPKNIDKAPASSTVQITDISDEELDVINNNPTADISNLPIAYDVIELAYISVYKYLRDDSGNVVFHFHNKFYTTTKDRLKSLSKDGTAVKYVCPNPGSMRVIEKSTPYLAGSSFGCPCGLLEMSKIKSIIETPTIQVLEIVPFEPEKTAPSTASLSVLEGGTYVSSSHCQEGQGEVIHNLRELPMHMRRRQRQTRRRASPAQTNRTRRSPRPCPEGKVRNPATGRCVNAQSRNAIDARQRPCPEGKIRNPATGRCINDPANAQRRTRRRTPSS